MRRVDTKIDFEWDDYIVDCARVANLKLPDPSTAAGSEVRWETIGFPQFGTIADSDAIGDDPRGYVAWFSHSDLAGFFSACVEAPGIKYEIVYGASANTWKIYDTASGWKALGFTPSDNAEDHRPKS